MSTKRSPRILAVASGKGGVGKSTVAASLALALHRKGRAVGLLDADLYGPSLSRMLPVETAPEQVDGRIRPAICQGIKLVSMAYFRRQERAVAVRAPIANGILKQFVEQVDWGELDDLIIDFPPGTGDIQLTLAQQLPITGAVLVTTPQVISLLDVARSIALFEQMRVPIVGVIENMSYLSVAGERHYPFGSEGGSRLANDNGLPLLGQIPLDPELCRRCDAGELSRVGGSSASVALNALLDGLEEEFEKLSDERPQFQIKNRHTLTIAWNREDVRDYSLDELQKRCPCAGCAESPPEVNSAVQADRVEPIGRYGLRVHFSLGCSQGIYGFDQLKDLQKNEMA